MTSLEVISCVQEYGFLSIAQDLLKGKVAWRVLVPVAKYKTKDGYRVKEVYKGEDLEACKAFINRTLRGHRFSGLVSLNLVTPGKNETLVRGQEIQVDPRKTYLDGEEEALKGELDAIMRRAVSRHLFCGDPLYILTLKDSRGNFLYAIASAEQSLYYVPTGAGGTRWPGWLKVTKLNQGISIGFKSSKRVWCLTKIEPLNLGDLESPQQQ